MINENTGLPRLRNLQRINPQSDLTQAEPFQYKLFHHDCPGIDTQWLLGINVGPIHFLRKTDNPAKIYGQNAGISPFPVSTIQFLDSQGTYKFPHDSTHFQEPKPRALSDF